MGLTNTTGASAGVDIALTSGSYRNFNSATASTTDWVNSAAQTGGWGLDHGESATLSFSGLMDGFYSIEVVSARETYNYINTFTVAGNLADHTFSGAAVGPTWNSTTDGLNPVDWLIWDNVEVTGGTFSLVHGASSSTLGVINALQFSAVSDVPLPAGGLLLLSGLGGVAFLKRRKKRSA